MQYLALLGGDESLDPTQGSPEWDAMLVGYRRFGTIAGDAIVAGEALQPTATAATVRHGDGAPLVTDGPYAETSEAIGGFYVLEAATLDDAIELAKEIPAAATGWVGVRPMEGWYPAEGDPEVTGVRYMAIMYGKESTADTPGTPEWEAERGRARPVRVRGRPRGAGRRRPAPGGHDHDRAGARRRGARDRRALRRVGRGGRRCVPHPGGRPRRGAGAWPGASPSTPGAPSRSGPSG